MEYLSGMLCQLTKGLAMRRHRMEQKEDGITEIYVKLNEYLYLCRKKQPAIQEKIIIQTGR